MGRRMDEDEDGVIGPDAPTVGPKHLKKTMAAEVDPDKTTRALDEDVGEDDEEGDRTRRYGGNKILPVGWLVVISGPQAGLALPIQSGRNSLGRSKAMNLTLPASDKTVSSENHAWISYNRKTREFRVTAGAGPETWMGDTLVESEPLARGDKITVGETELRFVPFCDDSFDWTDVLPK